jgi:molecular chaperone Hsp33
MNQKKPGERTKIFPNERKYEILRQDKGAEMSDYIVRAAAADLQIRAFAITSKELVERARSIHNTSPVATAALGRLLSAGAMMGAMMKGENDLLTLQIKGDGPIGGITVTADSKARVKGYVNEPAVLIHANSKGKLDVAGAVGNGMLRVIKDLGLKEPYVGQTELQTGEIAEDLTYYFATSEQVPSSVGLGVLLNRDNTIRQAGGFIIQLMPFTGDKVIDELEKKLSEVSSVTALLDQGLTPEELLERLLGDFGLEITDTLPASYYCNCTRERVEQAIVSIGSRDIREMIQENKPIEVKCQFCDQAYTFDVEDLKRILAKAKR